jgi:DNA polymerase type B, organellar and viral
MKEYPMPTGNPIYFEGDILQINPNAYGFFECKISSPDGSSNPILLKRMKTDKGLITIAPIGKWLGSYLSEELFNALKHGYTFKVLRGYLFDKEYIFKDYVDFLYNLKVNSSKDTPDYIISKLLLNSLYGRFGMSPYMENHIILESNSLEATSISKNKIITDILHLNNGKDLISYLDNKCDKDWDRILNISIPISAAVTAFARIHMSQFKNRDDFTLFYTDTDSIDINKPLEPKFVGKELGKMKLEHVFDRILFLAPKVYSGITSSNKITKVKGYKIKEKFTGKTNNIELEKLLPLLNKK